MDTRAKILDGLGRIPLVDPSLQPELALLEEAELLSRRRLRDVVRCGDWRKARSAAVALACLWDTRSASVLWQRVFCDAWRDLVPGLYFCELAFGLNRDRWHRIEVRTALRQLQASEDAAEREFLLRVVQLCGLPQLGERWRRMATVEALRALEEPWPSAYARGAAVDILAAACVSQDALVAALDHSEPEVRRRAAAALGNRPLVTDHLISKLVNMAANDHAASIGIELPVSRTARAALARVEYRAGEWAHAAVRAAELQLGAPQADVADADDLSTELLGGLSLMRPHFQLAWRPAFGRLAGGGLCNRGGLRRLLATLPVEQVETVVRAVGCLGLIELVPDLWQVVLDGDATTAEVRVVAGITAHLLDERHTPAMANRMATALGGPVGPARQEVYLRLLAMVAWVLPEADRARLTAVAANRARDATTTPAARQAAQDLTGVDWT